MAVGETRWKKPVSSSLAFSLRVGESDKPSTMTPRVDHRRRPVIIISAAGGLLDLDAAAVWILGAVRLLLRRGRPALRDAWLWVECFDDLMERMVLIREHPEQPANRCPIVPVCMPVEVDVWPKPGEALPPDYEHRQLGAVDNRRLVGKVAQVLIDHIALSQQVAVRYLEKAQRDGSAESSEKADAHAMQVRERGRIALRGVDLEELAHAVELETRATKSVPRAASTGPNIEFVNDKLAIVSEGGTKVQVKGPRQVRLFRSVVEAAGTVAWSDLVRADLSACGEELSRRWRVQERGRGLVQPTTPRHSTREESLQRTGTRIRTALGKLGYYWEQDGHGAYWKGKDDLRP